MIHFIGHGGPAQIVLSNGNSSSFNHHTLAKIQMQPSSGGDVRISNTRIAHEDNSNYYTGNGNVGYPTQNSALNYFLPDY